MIMIMDYTTRIVLHISLIYYIIFKLVYLIIIILIIYKKIIFY